MSQELVIQLDSLNGDKLALILKDTVKGVKDQFQVNLYIEEQEDPYETSFFDELEAAQDYAKEWLSTQI